MFCRQDCRFFWARNMGSTPDTVIKVSYSCEAADAGSSSATLTAAVFSTRSG